MELDIEKIIREYIDKTVHMSLATVGADSKPWVCEVHFGFDDELNLYFLSKAATRHCTEISTNPNVAGNIVVQHSLEDSPHGVYYEGVAEAVENPSDEQISAYSDRLGRNKDDVKALVQPGSESNLYKISVKNWAIFGKFGLEKNQKHELKWSS